MRLRPSASSSSMKMMQGAAFRACSNRSRTRAAPTPTNISTNWAPEIEKYGTPASPATARASSVPERHLGVGLDIDLGARFSDRHQAAEPLALRHVADAVSPDQVEDEDRQYPGQDR